jgi:hypothetical protein
MHEAAADESTRPRTYSATSTLGGYQCQYKVYVLFDPSEDALRPHVTTDLILRAIASGLAHGRRRPCVFRQDDVPAEG